MAVRAPLSGHKRKHRSMDECRQLQNHSPAPGSTFDKDHESENLAWLDMLVALSERKYGKHSIPVSVEALEDAKLFEPRQKKQQQQQQSSNKNMFVASAGSSQQNSNSSSTSRLASDQHLPGKEHSMADPCREAQARLEKEKDERRQRILRRHAQQIQDASVSSNTCCGCKTGCLKMCVFVVALNGCSLSRWIG